MLQLVNVVSEGQGLTAAEDPALLFHERQEAWVQIATHTHPESLVHGSHLVLRSSTGSLVVAYGSPSWPVRTAKHASTTYTWSIAERAGQRVGTRRRASGAWSRTPPAGSSTPGRSCSSSADVVRCAPPVGAS